MHLHEVTLFLHLAGINILVYTSLVLLHLAGTSRLVSVAAYYFRCHLSAVPKIDAFVFAC